MDKAAQFMGKKGYSQWKSFTTGKSGSLGGIPHDVYGMTTRSVRAYCEGIQKKLNLVEEKQTKLITGGPDGDLGSNEIKMSKEIIIGIVDGSGVLYDPQGLDREALMVCVKNRSMVNTYKGKLSSQGYYIGINDNNKTLPCGTFVESGMIFRNNFHLNQDVSGDFFVPCGGRPDSINTQNIGKMFKKNGQPRFKYIVEGANLFISEAARNQLEAAGVIVFKDASTNKGGVTSSSFEVLACLSLNEQEFQEHMSVQGKNIPKFYQDYVVDIQQRIKANAIMEFNYIWNEKHSTGKHATQITNQLSEKMNDLCDVINQSDLFENEDIREKVLIEYIPQTLLNLLGIKSLRQRIPIEYQRAMFSAHLSSKFYYSVGSDSNVYHFYEFMRRYQ